MLQPAASAPSGTDKKLAGLDHLRAGAINLVFLFHYSIFYHPDWIDKVGSFGWTGVDLFFVLSGYLIAGQLFQQVARTKKIALKEFFLKRFFRIIPAYATVVALYFLVPLFREREALSPLWKFITFTQNFGLDLRHTGTFLHAWSLCIEEQFYLLLPFLILLFVSVNRGGKAVYFIIALFVLGFFLRLISWNHFVLPLAGSDEQGIAWYKWIYYPTYNRLDGLLAGVSIAGLCRFYPQVRAFIASQGNLLLVAGLSFLGVAYWLCLHQNSVAASVFGFPLIAIGYGAILAAAISPACFLYRVRSKISSHLAALSYAVYLTHKGIIHLTQEHIGRLGVEKGSNGMFFCCIFSTLLGALALRYAVEKPFLKLRDSLLKRRTTGNRQQPAAVDVHI